MRLITDFRVHNLAMMMKHIISLFGWGCDELQTTLSKAYLASHIPLWILPHLEFRNGPSLHLIARIYPFLVHNHFPSEELGESDNRLTLSFLSIIIILLFSVKVLIFVHSIIQTATLRFHILSTWATSTHISSTSELQLEEPLIKGVPNLKMVKEIGHRGMLKNCLQMQVRIKLQNGGRSILEWYEQEEDSIEKNKLWGMPRPKV